MKHAGQGLSQNPIARIAASVLDFIQTHRLSLPMPDDATLSKLWDLAVHISAGARIGLTNYPNPDQIFSRLILPSLATFYWLPAEQALRAVEIGCGSGAVGLTLAVLAPAWQITLVDRRERAVAFVDVVKVKLGLSNVRTLKAEAEKPPALAPFDCALFRAVASPSQDLEIARGWLKAGGTVIIWTNTDEVPAESPLWQKLDTVLLTDPPLAVLAYRFNPQ